MRDREWGQFHLPPRQKYGGGIYTFWPPRTSNTTHTPGQASRHEEIIEGAKKFFKGVARACLGRGAGLLGAIAPHPPRRGGGETLVPGSLDL